MANNLVPVADNTKTLGTDALRWQKTYTVALDNGDVAVNVGDLITAATAPVTSVNSETGAVSLSAADVGAIATTAIVTTVGTPGDDDKVPSEQAVRELIDALPAGGDMTKLVYDSNDDGTVDAADYAASAGVASEAGLALSVAWDNVTSKSVPESLLSLSDNTTADATTVKHGLLPKLSGAASQYLGGDGQYHDMPMNASFFLVDTASDIGGYKTLTVTRSTSAEATVATAVPANDTLVASFAAVAGLFELMPSEVLHTHVHLAKTAGTKTCNAYVKVFHRTSGGTETLLGTSETHSTIAGTNTAYDFDIAVVDTPFAATDRLVVKVYGTPGGAGTDPTLTVYYQGVNETRLEVGTNLVASGGTAATTTVDASGFAGNLSGADTDVQTALATIDGLSLGGGSLTVEEAGGTPVTSVTTLTFSESMSVELAVTETVAGQATVTHTLVGDEATPGNFEMYGTGGAGAKGWFPQADGAGSIENNSGNGLHLKGDADTPGNSKLYGTNGSGTKGWYDQPAAGSGSTKHIKEWLAGSLDFDYTPTPSLDRLDGTYLRRQRLRFDDTTEEFSNTSYRAPTNLDAAGTVTFYVRGLAVTPAASKNVQMKVYYIAVADGEAADVAFSELASGDKAISDTAGDEDIIAWTETVANLGWAAGDALYFKISRIAASANGLTGDYGPFAFGIIFPVSG